MFVGGAEKGREKSTVVAVFLVTMRIEGRGMDEVSE